MVCGVFEEDWRSRHRLIDMYGMYWFKYGCIYRYTVSMCKYKYLQCEVFGGGISGGLETLSEA